jgi:hypothetical protein
MYLDGELLTRFESALVPTCGQEFSTMATLNDDSIAHRMARNENWSCVRRSHDLSTSRHFRRITQNAQTGTNQVRGAQFGSRSAKFLAGAGACAEESASNRTQIIVSRAIEFAENREEAAQNKCGNKFKLAETARGAHAQVIILK